MRRMGAWAALALVVSEVVGVGILVAGLVAGALLGRRRRRRR